MSLSLPWPAFVGTARAARTFPDERARLDRKGNLRTGPLQAARDGDAQRARPCGRRQAAAQEGTVFAGQAGRGSRTTWRPIRAAKWRQARIINRAGRKVVDKKTKKCTFLSIFLGFNFCKSFLAQSS